MAVLAQMLTAADLPVTEVVLTLRGWDGKRAPDPERTLTLGRGPIHEVAKVPVAPLHYIQRADGKWRGIFEQDPLEAQQVLPHYSMMYIVAREHRYSGDEFDLVRRALEQVVPDQWSPHLMWHVAIATRPKHSEQTYFELALGRYQAEYDEIKSKRRR